MFVACFDGLEVRRTFREREQPDLKSRRSRIVDLIRFDLEWVVEIGVLASHSDPDAAGQVGGDEERAPAFVLADVDSLVAACPMQRFLVTPQNDVPQSDRGDGADPTVSSSQDCGDPASVSFQNSVDDAATTACHQSQKGEQQANGRAWKDPDVKEWAKYSHRFTGSSQFNSTASSQCSYSFVRVSFDDS